LGVDRGPKGDLLRFHGQAVLLRVQRGESIIHLPGSLEGHFDEYEVTWKGRPVQLGPTLLIRCGGPLPTDGDSGAPVLAYDGDRLTLLGFHIGRTEATATAAPLAYAMIAWPALGRAGLALAD
jgi:hypothetical protein